MSDIDYPFNFHVCGGCGLRVSQTNECPGRERCANVRLVCSGCGETYPANQIEGNLHDHWTEADA